MPTNRDGEGGSKLTAIIRYPEKLPNAPQILAMGVILDFPTYEEELLGKEIENIRSSVLKKLKFIQIDLSDRSGIAGRLNDLNRSIEEIGVTKRSLGEFIKTAFPIKDIID